MKTPLVTLLGRPNTGKSTLFNRLAGARIAIESEVPGTTRDRIFVKVETPDLDFFLVDTGGLEFDRKKSSLEGEVKRQAELAAKEADLILLVVEGNKEGAAEDREVVDFLRKKVDKKSIILLANKCDKPVSKEELASLYKLGLGDPFPVSAIHNRGITELEEKIIKILKGQKFLKAPEPKEAGLKLALLGKPNVGKSSLINTILGKPRLIVSAVPGTTRDATDTVVTYQKRPYNFIDTAGLRRQAKRERGLEELSVLRTLRAIERCDIALLLLDATESPSHQDQQIANLILEAGKGLILIVNKWDLLKKRSTSSEPERNRWIHALQIQFPFAPWAPVIFTSAVTRENVEQIFSQIETVRQERAKRISTGSLNRFMEQITRGFRPAAGGRGIPKIFYLTQIGVEPPTFVLFVNKKKNFHFSYLRYLENRLREHFGFIGTPIKLLFREKVSKRRI